MLPLHQIIPYVLEKIKLMKIDSKIRDEKLQYDTNRSSKIISFVIRKNNDEYEYLTGEEILPHDKRRVVELGKFPYSPLEKTFEK